ncbi:MAG: NUDIX domain-containing protein [Aliidiomarina sp.]|uniref:NUDIX domain-containing protein n=1 Tax=Aliidiomarina sp. TaxID=1872439 RepID=UPI0025B9B933|nr:NUDIX domain-containing protein [Aliidiomarina sp.]MCH8501295.1 NUDIX domain-containing protein [Aliidiomarina sp.]
MASLPKTMQKHVHVAVGVITHGASVLVSKRADHQHQGGLWEFPGGKVETDEAVKTALARELKEELNVTVLAAAPMFEIVHDYGDKVVHLDIWHVSQHTGEVLANEGQAWQWADADTLRELKFPAANGPIVTATLKLID